MQEMFLMDYAAVVVDTLERSSVYYLLYLDQSKTVINRLLTLACSYALAFISLQVPKPSSCQTVLETN